MPNYNTEDLKSAVANYSDQKAIGTTTRLSYDPSALTIAVKNHGGTSKSKGDSLSGYSAADLRAATQNYYKTEAKKRFDVMSEAIESSELWQPAERMDEIVSLIEYEKKSNLFGIDESWYDAALSNLKNKRDTYRKYPNINEYTKATAQQEYLLTVDTDDLAQKIEELKRRQSSILNVDGSKDLYEERLYERADMYTSQLNADNRAFNQGYTDEEILKMAMIKAKTDPDILILAAESNVTGEKTVHQLGDEIEEKTSLRNQAIKLQKEERLTLGAMEADDFIAKSRFDSKLVNPNDDARWSAIYAAANGGSKSINANTEFSRNAAYMDESERAIFNYYFATDRAKAEEYIGVIEERLNARRAGRVFESKYKGKWLLEELYGFYAGLDNFATGVINTFSSPKEYYSANTTQQLSGLVRNDLSDRGFLWSMAYDVNVAAGQMAPAIVTSKLLGGSLMATALGSAEKAATVGAVTGNALFGVSTYGNSYASMINEGYTKEQAQAYGLLASASEVGLNYLLGGTDALSKTRTSALSKVASQLDDGFLKTAITLADKIQIFSFSEMTEEGLQEILDPVFKSIAIGMDHESMKDIDYGQIFYAGVLGGFTASVLNNTGRIADVGKTYIKGRSLKKSGINVDGLRELGQKIPADTVANKLANKVTEKSGAYKIARLFNAVGAELTRQNQADIVDNLTRKGVLASDAETIATYLAAAVNGAEFTVKQIKAIEGNPLIAEAMRETLIDPSSSVSRRTAEAKRSMWGNSPVAESATTAAGGEVEYAPDSEQSPLSEEERQRRIQEIESGDFSGIRRFAGITESPQQGAVGSVSRPQNSNARPMNIPTVTEDPSWTKTQRQEHIEADVRESARQFGIGEDVAESIAYIAGRTGTHVLFVDRVAMPNGTSANGYFDNGQNLLLISKDAEAPVYEVVKHELVHSIAGTKLYGDLVNFVKNSPQIKRVLKAGGIEFEQLVEAKMAEYAANGVELTFDGAVEEIVAEYAAKYLLTDQQSIAELFKAQQNVFYKFLYNIRTWLKNIRTPKDQRLLQQAERLYVKALSKKGKRYYKSKYDAEQFDVSDGKYAIKTLPDGKRRYVQAEHQVIRGEDPALWEDQIISYVNDVIIKNGKEIKIITEEGDTLTINGRTAWKLGERNKRRGGKRIGDDFYRAKGNAAGHIDELAETSSLTGKKPYKEHGRKGEPFGVDGFDYRTAFFRDLDGSYYRMRLSIGKDGNLKTVYNIGEIKKVPFPVNGSKAQAGTAPLDNTVPQSGAVVNTQYTQEGGEYSIGTGEDFETQMLRLVEQYGAQPKGFAPERDVAIPKSITGTDRVSLTARTIAESKSAMPDSMLEELNRALLNEALSYTPKSNASELSFANEKLTDLGYEGALDYWRSKQQDDTSAGGNVKALGAVLLHEAARRGDTRAVMELSVGICLDNTNAGQAIQATVLIKKLTPEGRVYALQKLVNRLNADNGKKNQKAAVREEADSIRRRIREAQKRGAHQSVIEALQQELNEVDGSLYLPEAAVQEILAQTTPEGTEEAFKKALVGIAQQKPATWTQKWNQWRYLAMLANLRTHDRNVFSNTLFLPVVQVKNLVKFGLETIFQSKLSERTTSFGNHFVVQERYRDFVQKDYETMKDEIQSGGKYNPEDVLSKNQQIFKTKPLEWLRKKNSDLLEAEDAIALRFHYTRAMAQYLSANGIDVNNIDPETLGKARTYATKEAQKATFRDESVIASWLYESSKKNIFLNVVIEGIVPFKKTPTNVLRRGLEYSPVGIAEAFIDLAKMKKGDPNVTLNDVLDRAAAGITGSAIMVLGAWLAHLGVLRLRGPEKEKEEDWRNLLGQQNYSIVIGDSSYTIDWAAPSVLPLFVGAELNNLFSSSASFGEILETLTRVSDPVMELSMMQGIQDTIKSSAYGGGLLSILGSTATSYLSQGLPTIGGQIARVVDDTRRQNYVEKDAPFASLQYSAQQAMGKIPGLASKRKEYVNQWGETEYTGNIAERAFENMLSPGYYAKNRDGRVEDEITRLYEATNDSGVLPSSSIKSFTAEKKDAEEKTKYALSAQESTEYQKKKGTMSYNLLKKVIPSNAYESMDDKQRAYTVGKVYAYATEKAEQVIMKKRGDEYEGSAFAKKIDTVISDDKDIADYLLFAYWNKETVADKDRKGNTISGSKKKKIRQAAKDAGYTTQEIKYFMNLLGYSF